MSAPEERPFAEEYPHLTGCLKNIAGFVGGYAMFTVVCITGGYVAAFWFGLGFIIAALIALCEGVRNELAEDRDQ